MPSYSRALIHVFGVLEDNFIFVIPRCRENGNEPEECLAGCADIFFTDGSKTDQELIFMIKNNVFFFLETI